MKAQVVKINATVEPDSTPQRTLRTVFYIYCKDENLYSYVVRVVDFQKTFYVRESDINYQLLIKQQNPLFNYSTCLKKNFYGYGNPLEKFIKITVPNHFEKKNVFDFLLKFKRETNLTTFEYGLDIVMEFKRAIRYTGWIEFETDDEVNGFYNCSYDNIDSIEMNKVLHLSVLSFDIECVSMKGGLPKDTDDPIIMIGCSHQVGNQVEDVMFMFVYDGICECKSSAKIKYYKTERGMLIGWIQYVNDIDPDILTGYNIQGFDFPYILTRMKVFGLSPRFGRRETVVVDKKIKYKLENTFNLTNRILIEGRIVLDMLGYVKSWTNTAMRSYKLNAVAEKFLNDKKDDVAYDQILPLYKDTETRHLVVEYCIKDALLPIRLIERLKSIYTIYAMSRVVGLDMDYITNRKQQVRVMSQLLLELSNTDYIIPDMRDYFQPTENIAGAFVVDPIPGLYTTPIVTLDFASLYPSIMIAHNLCYSTRCRDKTFVTENVQEGILPKMLKMFVAERTAVRQTIKSNCDEIEKLKKIGNVESVKQLLEENSLLDCRQLALKVSSNSVYGFTGFQNGELPCLDISRKVTGYGREMIKASLEFVEKTCGFKVIYGDTDSIMINVGDISIAEAINIGKELAKKITPLFNAPCKMTFEKVYCPYLLICKKRYAGHFWTRPEEKDKTDIKGLDCIRTDNCRLQSWTLKACIDFMLANKISEMKEYVRNVVDQLNRKDIDLFLLQTSKQMTKEISDYKGLQPHVELVSV